MLAHEPCLSLPLPCCSELSCMLKCSDVIREHRNLREEHEGADRQGEE